MAIYELTEAEEALIINHRNEVAAERARRAFTSKALVVAQQFDAWSAETGEGLTFSTFINTFKYQEQDGKLMYETVKRIYEAI